MTRILPIIALLFATATISGCASAPSSQAVNGFNPRCGFLCKIEPPVRISESSYIISGSTSTEITGDTKLQIKLLSAASGFCQSKNLELLALEKEEDYRAGSTYGSLEFACKSYAK